MVFRTNDLSKIAFPPKNAILGLGLMFLLQNFQLKTWNNIIVGIGKKKSRKNV